ncbi:MAG: hypothetical protein ACJ77M_13390 [Thermoleophilaceae bacterium]|jgi:hypothetical protein
MTRKTLGLALVAALALSAPASANTLSLSTAKQLAKRLAAKQVRTRQIVSLHIVRPHRVSAREIKFLYDDRSAQNVFCTSAIIVKLATPTSKTAKASFDNKATVCRGMSADALAYEAATRTALRDVGAQAAAIRTSLADLKRSSAPCKRLRVPSNRRRQVALFTASANTTAEFGPAMSQLQSFSNAIGSVSTTDSVLVAGAAGWADLLEVYRSLPTFQPSLCGAVKRWAAAHWAAGSAPADFTALKALDTRALRDEKAISRASAHLADVGVFPRTAVGFTPPGMVALGAGVK